MGDEEGAEFSSAIDCAAFYDVAWQVRKDPVYRRGMRLEEERFYVVRDVDDCALGIVGQQYEVLQYTEAIEFLWLAVERGDLKIERVIPMRGGRRLIMVARRPEHVLIAGEPIDQYMVFSTGHTGEWPFIMQSTAHREFCKNIFIVKGLPKVPNLYKLRHVRNIKYRAADMERTIRTSNEHMKHLKDLGDGLASVKITDREFNQYLAKLIPVPAPEKDENGRVSNQRAIDNANERRLDIAEIYYLDDNLNDIRGTAWGAFQATVQYNDWKATYRSPERRLERIVNGGNSNQRALNLIREV